MRLIEQLIQHSIDRPQSPAVSRIRADGSLVTVSYADLADQVEFFAGQFAELRGSILPFVLPRSALSVAAMYGCFAAGISPAHLNTKLRPGQIFQMISASGSSHVLADERLKSSLMGSMSREQNPPTFRWLTAESIASASLSGNRVRSLIRPPLRPALANPQSHGGSFSPACCLFTSGSTGVPKGVMIAASDLDNRAESERSLYELTTADVVLNVLPLCFDVGLNQVLSSLLAGSHVVLLDSWFPSDILATMSRMDITGISAVPPIWIDLLTKKANTSLTSVAPSIRYVAVSGGSLSDAHLDQFDRWRGDAALYKTYGQTETFRSTALRPGEFSGAERSSVGRPLPGVRIYVVKDDGSRCSPLEEGEIVHTGVGMMTGYIGDAAGSLVKLRPNPFQGPEDPSPTAIYTGDYGYLNEGGFLFLLGRRDDMIKVRGQRAYPQEIKNFLIGASGVLDAEVIATGSSSQRDTMLTAYLVVDDRANFSLDALRLLLLQNLPSHLIPASYRVVNTFPRTASGKVDRQALLGLADC